MTRNPELESRSHGSAGRALSPGPVVGADHAEDLELVRRILAGSREAWEAFVEQYSGLIAAVIRRYLGTRNREELRNLHVAVLASMVEGKLAGYRGRAALSTWITVVARSAVVDVLRRRLGRRRLPKGLRHLREEDRLIYTLYFLEGLGLGVIVERLRQLEATWTLPRVVARLRAIEDLVDDRMLRRIAYDVHAQSIGAASGRLLEYLDHVRLEYAQNEGTHGPEYHVMEREARHLVERLRAEVAAMEPRDRQVLEMRFERSWSAERIADELGLKPRRRVYTILERLVRVLKRRLKEWGDAGDDA